MTHNTKFNGPRMIEILTCNETVFSKRRTKSRSSTAQLSIFI